MRAWISKMLSDPAGLPDDSRVAAMLLVLAYIALSAWSVIDQGHAFSMVQFGAGAGTLAGGIGAWLGLRKGN